MAGQEPKEQAIELKNKGNEAFKNHDWPSAVSFYTQAIELYNKEPSFYTNRAQVPLPPLPPLPPFNSASIL